MSKKRAAIREKLQEFRTHIREEWSIFQIFIRNARDIQSLGWKGKARIDERAIAFDDTRLIELNQGNLDNGIVFRIKSRRF